VDNAEQVSALFQKDRLISVNAADKLVNLHIPSVINHEELILQNFCKVGAKEAFT
jgi:hypothetical protein